MKVSRAVLSGVMIWLQIFTLFTAISFIPVLKESSYIQSIVIFAIVIPIVISGVWFYYRKEKSAKALHLALIIILTSLVLDAIITVPFIIIPEGGNYLSFFTDPNLLLLALEIVMISFAYYKFQIRKS